MLIAFNIHSTFQSLFLFPCFYKACLLILANSVTRLNLGKPGFKEWLLTCMCCILSSLRLVLCPCQAYVWITLHSSKFTIIYIVTSATGAIFVLFDGAVFSTNVFPFSIEITRMTGSAIDSNSLRGGILRMGIRKRSVHGVAVTAATTWVLSVIARVAPLSAVLEAGRCPAVC